MSDDKQNTGYYNAGNRNAGNWNPGDYNTGNLNPGHYNTGNLNTGHCNTGSRNTGHRNTGNWNQCDYETGAFNTKQSDTIRVFNKPCSREVWKNCEKPDLLYFSLTKWIPEQQMTDKEKTDNPTFSTTGGYLKEFSYKEAFRASWDAATDADREAVKNLPNFDAEVFFQISGIDVRQSAKCHHETIVVDGVEYVKKESDR